MEINNVKSTYSRICQHLFSKKVVDASVELKKLIRLSGREYYMDQLDQYMMTYENILKHSFTPIKDPQRDKVYFYLIRNMLEMADEIKEHILTQAAIGNVYGQKHHLITEHKAERKEALTYLDSLTFEKQLTSILKQSGIGDDEGQRSVREDELGKIFNIIWLTDKYNDTEINLLNAVCDSDLLPWYDKGLVVSALTLSLLRYFDVNKFLILFRFLTFKEQFVWQRAMVGLFLCFMKYNDRYHLYPALHEKVMKLQEFDNIEKNIEAILIQYTKTRETETVTQKWEKDILPRMMKLRPKLEEKLDLDNIFKDEFGEEKNPDWETVFEDAPDLLDKLQEFTELQMEGMDVFMSAFSQLKNFPFFQKLSNWFVPFYHENKAIQPFLRSPDDQIDLTPLVQKLETTYFMCNSDKYSFCINLGLIPEQQKTMMMNMVNAEMDSVSEVEKGEGLINEFARTRSIYTQYFQDLYRFVKLHPWRDEFDDIFAMEIDLFHTSFVSNIISDKKTIRNIAEFYFDKKFYPYALNIFLSLLERDRSNIELFEKIAYCYENQGDFENALDYYQRADLIESNRPWILKKMALCSKYLNNWSHALDYYKQAAILEPDDLKIQANIGQCLIHTREYEQALDYYFKIEVLAPENHRIRRPLAWCSFILGKFETAKDYLQRLLAVDPENMHDLMNLGHVHWCQGNEEKAFDLYCQSFRAGKNPKVFENSFNEDRKHIQKHNISSFEMDLMLEYVKMKA
jgi:tetratricopeptide (TPR) repeat protein